VLALAAGLVAGVTARRVRGLVAAVAARCCLAAAAAAASAEIAVHVESTIRFNRFNWSCGLVTSRMNMVCAFRYI